MKAKTKTESKEETESSTESQSKEELESVKEIWNSFARQNKLSEIKVINGDRLTKLRRRLKNPLFKIFDILEMVKISDFLLGKKTNWKISFDFIIENETNYLKILEGNYKNGASEKSQPPRVGDNEDRERNESFLAKLIGQDEIHSAGEGTDRIALIELERSKGGKLIPEATKLFFANEFENLGWHIAKVLNAIKSAIYDNTYSDVKFSDFIDRENDDLIPQDLVFRKAMDTIKVHQEKFRLFCNEYYGTTLISREQVSKILDLLNKNEISHYDLQSTKKNIEWLKAENDRVENMRKNLFDKKDEVRELLEKIIADAYNNSDIPDENKKASAEANVYLCIKELNKSL